MTTTRAIASFRFPDPYATISVCAALHEQAVIEAVLFGDSESCKAMIEHRSTDESCFVQPSASPRLADLLQSAFLALEDYFATGVLDTSLPLAPHGSAFDQSVWNELLKIPSGTTCTYGQIARRLNQPRAAQAVGGACGRNPIAIFIPCHRVLDSRGSLHGYAGGLERKAALLECEHARAVLFVTAS